VMFLVLPICAGLILVAVPLIRTIYGDRWVPAAGVLQILAVFGLLRSLASFSGYLFEGIGKPSNAFYVGMFRLAVVASIVIPMILWLGLIGAAVAATCGVAAEYAFGLMFLRKHLRMTLTEISAVLWRPFFTTLIMSGCVYLYLSMSDSSPTVELVAAILIGAVVYASLNGRVLLELRRDLNQLRE
jgi:lipopolysaccharide exporter